MRREYRELFSRHRLQSKPLVSSKQTAGLARAVMHAGITNQLWRGNLSGFSSACWLNQLNTNRTSKCNFELITRRNSLKLCFHSTGLKTDVIYLCHLYWLRKCYMGQASDSMAQGVRTLVIMLFTSNSQNNTLPMMTSSDENIHRVTGHLCGEFTGHRWIRRTKASVAELWCFQ